MRVFIANFGRENYAWPECLTRSSIATMNDVAVHGFWESGDREAYIEYSLKNVTTAAGISATRPVASRWFNLMTIIVESAGDIWIHREKDQLWWTTSTNALPVFEHIVEPVGDKRGVVICHKPCEPWSNQNRNGNRLDWRALHPKACEFLFTEGTLQQLSEDNANYALTLIEGGDLEPWHSRPEWKVKAETAQASRSLGKVLSAKERAAFRMAKTAMETAASANGQAVQRNTKNKEFGFSSEKALAEYVSGLIDAQEGLCAISELPLQFDGDQEDNELLASLDRTDSDGHYEEGNLQVVCRFINRWKSDANDDEFRRLLALVR